MCHVAQIIVNSASSSSQPFGAEAPAEAGSLGMLLICLPWPFEGGALTLQHAGQQVHALRSRV